MFAQQTYRPEIARVAEETVLNLKQLESRIEVLKNDLATLCTVLGHPEAARIAVTPASWLGVTAPHLMGNVGSVGLQGQGNFGIGQGTPFQGQVPPGVSPYMTGFNPLTQGINPYGINPLTSGFSHGISPLTQGYPGVSPYAQGIGSPYGISPFVNPLLAQQGFAGFR